LLRRIVASALSRRGLVRLAAVALVLALAAPQAWAWYQLRAGKSALAKYHPEEARRALASCANVWGERPSVRLLASRAARQAGDLEAADRELRAAQQLSAGATEETAFEWALLQAASGNVLEVEEYLQRRADQSPEVGPLAWEALAVGYLRLYRTIDAMACLNYWLRREPDNVRALELRGQTYVTGKGAVRGADDYRRVLALDPARTDTRRRLVDCLLALGGYEEAAGHLERLMNENPDDANFASQLARCYNMLGRAGDARRLLDDALAKHPDHGACLRSRGQLALIYESPAEAEKWLRRAAAALPEDYQSQYFLFQALQAQGKNEESKAQIRLAEDVKERTTRLGELQSRKLAENPLDPALHYEMATLMFRTGHPDLGERWLTTALSLDPDHKPSHAKLAEYYEARGDKAKAEDHRKRAAQ